VWDTLNEQDKDRRALKTQISKEVSKNIAAFFWKNRVLDNLRSGAYSTTLGRDLGKKEERRDLAEREKELLGPLRKLCYHT
jgi:hypothetical protein